MFVGLFHQEPGRPGEGRPNLRCLAAGSLTASLPAQAWTSDRPTLGTSSERQQPVLRLICVCQCRDLYLALWQHVRSYLFRPLLVSLPISRTGGRGLSTRSRDHDTPPLRHGPSGSHQAPLTRSPPSSDARVGGRFCHRPFMTIRVTSWGRLCSTAFRSTLHQCRYFSTLQQRLDPILILVAGACICGHDSLLQGSKHAPVPSVLSNAHERVFSKC